MKFQFYSAINANNGYFRAIRKAEVPEIIQKIC